MPALLDTNVLVQAAHASSPLHEAAARLVERGLRTGGLYCIAPQNLVEFAAVLSRPRWATVALSPADILRMGNMLYSSRRLRKIYPTWGTVMRAIREGTALSITGPKWYDLFLAVTMRDAGVREIITENVQDFRQFPFVEPIPLRDAS